MNTAVNFTKAFTDTASGLSNFGSYGDAVRGSAAIGERLSKISLFSAREGARISGNWTGDVIAGMQKVCRAKETPLEYSSAVAEFAAETADSSLRRFAEFGEVARSAMAESLACCVDAEEGEKAAPKTAKKKTSKSALEKTAKSN